MKKKRNVQASELRPVKTFRDEKMLLYRRELVDSNCTIFLRTQLLKR